MRPSVRCNNQCTHATLPIVLHSNRGTIRGNRLHSQTTVLLQGVSWGGHTKFSLFSPLCSCLLTLKGDAAKFKPCYSWTKRHVRANLVRNWISAQRGSRGSPSINFLSSGTDDLFYCSSMTVWNVVGFHIWTAFEKYFSPLMCYWNVTEALKKKKKKKEVENMK